MYAIRSYYEILLEDEHPLVLDHEPDLAHRVEQVPELARPDGTNLDARRVLPVPLSCPLHAEDALFDHSDGPGSVPEVMSYNFV